MIAKHINKKNAGKPHSLAAPAATFSAVALIVTFNNSEFTQQDGRKKRTVKSLCVTNATGLFLACFVLIFT